jgi:hypothetical protein
MTIMPIWSAMPQGLVRVPAKASPIGNAITHNTTGAVLGGVGGALVGNQIARQKCGDRPDYYGRSHYERRRDEHRDRD